MLVNGYQLREAIKAARLRRESLSAQFSEILWGFDGEDKPGVFETGEAFRTAFLDETQLETWQQRYNQMVRVHIGSEEVMLTQAVKLVAAAGAVEKLWRCAAVDKGHDRYAGRELTRSKDDERAKRRVSQCEALAKQHEASRYAGAVRAAVAIGNNESVELDIDPSLVE